MNDDDKNAKNKALGDDAIGILNWIKKNKETATLIVTFIGVLGAWVGLIILGIQACAQQEQTRSLQEQTQIIQSDYEARNRPYLAIGNITTSEGKANSVEVSISVMNYGLAPATKVYLTDVLVGGENVGYDENTGIYTFTYSGKCDESSPTNQITDEKTGITITACGYVTALVNREQYPPDLLFFPGMTQSLAATFDNKLVYEATVTDTRVINVALTYSWTTKSYYCLAMATMEDDGSWVVKQQRGN